MKSYATLVEMQRDAVQKYGDRPLFGTRINNTWQWTSFKEFGAQVDAFAASLASLGLQKGDRIAIISNNRVEWAVTAYAAFRIGVGIVPMYEAQNDKEWAYILKDSGAKAALVANDSIASKIDVAHKIVVGTSFQDLLAKGKTLPAADAHVTASELACLLYTSGTTGKPKGVVLTHGNFTANVNAVQSVLPIGPGDRALSFLPWAHAFGQTGELHTIMSFGAAMALVDDVTKILDYLVEVKPAVLVSVPRIFNRIYTGVQQRMEADGGIKKVLFDLALSNENKRRAMLPKKSLRVELLHKVLDKLVFSKVRARFGGKLRFAVSGGAAISREVAEFIDKLGIIVLEGYGLTETAPVLSVNAINARRLGSVGKPLSNVIIKISAEGEVIGYGPNIMKGYYNLPDETAAVFTEDGGFRTGDLGYLDKDGYLFITGRIKEQYKLENGKYVAPAPLEELLKLSPYVLNALVYGDNKLYNVALIVANMDALKAQDVTSLSDPKAKQILDAEIERVTADFKGFEKIKKYKVIGEDFTTQNGMLTPKMSLKRKVILEKYQADLDALY